MTLSDLERRNNRRLALSLQFRIAKYKEVMRQHYTSIKILIFASVNTGPALKVCH